MFILDLFEDVAPMNTLVVYPGRFQPWHRGHHAVYNYLVSNFGRDRVYIATSNKVDPPRSPFSFAEKLQFMALTGIANDVVVETRDPYKVPELVQTVNAEGTRLIFAVSQKDMDEDPRFKFGTKKDGTPTYFQPMPKNAYDMQSLSKHAYIMVVPTFEFKVLGRPMRSATEIRAQFASANEETQKAIIKDLFGSYSREVHEIMKNKIGSPNLTESEEDDYRPPGAPYSSVARVLRKTQQALNGPNKFIWLKPRQITGSHTDQELISLGFKKSAQGSWGGTQSMWNRLQGIKENQLDQPTPTPVEIMRKHDMSTEELIGQLKLGIRVELEHTQDSRVAYEIALDHIAEDPDYYTKLTAAGLEEGEVIPGRFGGPYHKDPNIKVPMYDPIRNTSVAGDRLKGHEVPFERFITKPTVFGRAFNIIGITRDNKSVKISTTPSKELADTLADAYNRGGFTARKAEIVPLKQAFKPKDEA